MSPGIREAVPLAEQIACVEREIRLRESVYPNLVVRRRMSSSSVDIEMRRMRAVLRTLRHLARQETQSP